VLAAAARLETLGTEVVRVGVRADGALDLDALERALEAPTSLVSVMAVNNETGVLSPIDEVIARAHRRGALVHVDAVQAAGRIPLPLDADLLTLSGHKLGALKGVGALIKREHVPLEAQIVGGPQERGHRAGTEPVAQALSFAVALELALAEREAESARLGVLRARLDEALAHIPGARVLGRDASRVASTTAAVFPGVDGDAVLQGLDLEGIAASSGSACSSGSLEPSHVLVAMGVPKHEALSAVRFSMGFGTTAEDVDRVVAVLPRVVSAAREAMSTW
jgi:cysteine desulfurase